MNPRALVKPFVRVGLVWVVLTALVIGYGVDVVWNARELVEPAVEVLSPDFIAIMNPPTGALGEVGMGFRAMRPVPLTKAFSIDRGARLEESIPAGQDLLPAVLMLSLLAAWPYRTWVRALIGVCVGTLAGASLFVWTVAMHFAAQLEMLLQGYATTMHQPREYPTFMSHYIFVILGGEWLIAALTAMAIVICTSGGKLGFARETSGSYQAF